MNYIEDNLELKLFIESSNDIFQTNFDKFMISLKIMNNDKKIGLITESDNFVIYESKIKSIVDKLKELISSLIEKIKEFCTKSKNGIAKLFSDKKNDIDELVSNKNIPNEKVEIYDIKTKQDLLNTYINKMINLERKLMNIKVSNKVKLENDANSIIEYNDIIREIDKLNDEFDKSFLDENKDIIKMASKDAIRFSEKELKNVKVDFNELEKGSTEILSKFKEDANGCDIPIKANILQKMVNSVSTRVRKVVYKSTSYKHLNLKTILALSAALFVGKQALSNPKVQETVKNKMNSGIEFMKKQNEKIEKENEALKKQYEKIKLQK